MENIQPLEDNHVMINDNITIKSSQHSYITLLDKDGDIPAIKIDFFNGEEQHIATFVLKQKEIYLLIEQLKSDMRFLYSIINKETHNEYPVN